MTIQNDLSKKYSKGTIIIHWLTTILILSLFPLGKYMEGIEPADKMDLITIHAGLGILVFILTLFRSYLFFKSPRPADIKTGSNFNDKLVVWIHNIFYFLLFIIAISGVATMILGGYGDALQSGDASLIKDHHEIGPMKAHGISTLIVMILLVLHVVGIIKHYVMTKENTLKRMF